MPTIFLTPLRDDGFEIIVTKDVMDEAASGRLLVYEEGSDTTEDTQAIAHLEGSWTSSSSDPSTGRGRLGRAAAGKLVVATQRHATGADTRSEPKALPGWSS